MNNKSIGSYEQRPDTRDLFDEISSLEEEQLELEKQGLLKSESATQDPPIQKHGTEYQRKYDTEEYRRLVDGVKKK